jgi:hypothetical protein
MEGRVTAKVGLAPAIAVLLAVLAGESLVAAAAPAETSCLAAPGAQAPAGRHWFYRIEGPKQRKCWYLRAQAPGDATAKVAARHRPHVAAAAAEAPLPRPSDPLVPEIRLDPHAGQPAPAMADEQTTSPSLGSGVQAPPKADADTAAEPAASAPVASDASAALSSKSFDDRVGRSARGERIRRAHVAAATAAPSDARALVVQGGGDAATAAIPTQPYGYAASLTFVFAGAMLVLAGIFLNPIVRVFTRRPVFQTGGSSPVGLTSAAGEWTMPGFFARWRNARLDRREYHLDEI